MFPIDLLLNLLKFDFVCVKKCFYEILSRCLTLWSVRFEVNDNIQNSKRHIFTKNIYKI